MGNVLNVYICSLNAKSKDYKTLSAQLHSLCQNHSHVPFFNHSFVCQCWIEFAHLSRRVKGAAEWRRAVVGLLPFCATSAVASAHLPTSSEWHHFQDHLLQVRLDAPNTHSHIHTHTHIMKAKIMEKHFIPKRYSWVSLFYSFGHFSRTFASNALMLGGCTCLLRHRQANSFLGLILFIVTLLIP